MFDKTGTLTTGKPAVQTVVFVTDGLPLGSDGAAAPGGHHQQQQQPNGVPSPAPAKAGGCCGGSAPQQQQQPAGHGSTREAALLAVIAAVEEGSEHPLARAVVSYARQRLGPDAGGAAAAAASVLSLCDFTAQPGRGVRCGVLLPAGSAAAAALGSAAAAAGAAHVDADGCLVDVVIGNVAWMEECGVQLSPSTRQTKAQLEGQGATVVVAAVGGCAAALLAIADQVKPEAPAVLRALQRQGMRCWMITGDSRRARAAACCCAACT